ncbi:MAG: hypothetical protein NXH75_09550, partial [Halobacteriovoraceae bacterium]|nr:hypothetical protein [Halobacteriovoraceae bacterium]
MFHLKLVLFAFLLSVSSFASFKPSDYFSVDRKFKTYRKDKRAARAIEDFYWAFRKGKRRILKNSIAIVKKSKSSHFIKYLPVLRKGLKLTYSKRSNKPSHCSSISSDDAITRKLQRLYSGKCFDNNFKNLLKTKNINEQWLSFISDHFHKIKRYKYRRQLLPKLESVTGSNRVYLSNMLRSKIFREKRLPPKDFLPFLVINKELTRFIQEHRLFENDFQKEYSKEFKKLVREFKSNYLSGNDEEAKELLEDAITFYENNSSKISNKRAWQIFVSSGKKLARKDDSNLAIELFKLSEKVGDGDQAFESKFQSLFTLYRERKLDAALSFIKNERFLDTFNELPGKLQYWIGKVILERKEYKQAKKIFKTIIS